MNTNMNDVELVYHDWAKQYDEDTEERVNPSTAMEGNSLLTFLRPSHLDTILEIGCGTGRLTIPIAKECGKITAVDSSGPMLEVARVKSKELPNIEYRKLDITKRSPFQSASFD